MPGSGYAAGEAALACPISFLPSFSILLLHIW